LVGTVFPFVSKLHLPGILNQPQTPGLCKHGCVAPPHIPQSSFEQVICAHAPSTSLLLSFKNSESHRSGFSGSYTARYFIPSSRWGVIFWFRNCLVGPPWATDLSGLTVTGGGGIEPGRGVCAVGVAAAATVTGAAAS
jgi:hypothetical protein